MEPQSKLPEEDRPQITPDIPELKAQEGINGSEASQKPESSENAGETAGSSSQNGSVDPKDLSQRENAADRGSFNFNPINSTSPMSSLKSALWGSSNRKKATVGGGILATVFVIGGFLLTSLSGAAQLVQLSEVLQNDTKGMANISSARENSLLKYSTAGDLGETRLGILGKKLLRPTLQELNDKGVTFNTNPLNHFNGATIDTAQLEKSTPELKDLDREARITWLSNKLGVEPSQVTSVGGSDTVFNVDVSDASISSAGSVLGNIVGLLSDGKISSALNLRILEDYFGLPSLFRPLEVLHYKAARAAVGAADKDKEQIEDDEVSENDAVTESPAAVAADKDVNDEEGTFGNPAAKFLLVTGGVCFVRSVSGDIETINRDRIVLPSVIQAANFVAIGEEVKSGDGVSADQLNAVEQSLDNGNDTIWQGKSLQATEGDSNPGGNDIPAIYQQAYSPNSTAQNYSNAASDLVGGDTAASILCSPVGIFTQIVASVGLAFAEFSSDGAATPLEYATQALKEGESFALSGIVLDLVKNFILSSTTNGHLAKDAFSGSLGGNLLAYGAREMANIGSRSEGGVPQSGTDTQTYSYQTQQENNAEFKSEPLFARLFDVNDYRSLLGHLADSLSPSMVTTFANTINGFQGIGKDIVSNISSIIYPKAAAASSYNWGFPIDTIPPQILNDPNLADPYDNANQVEALFNSSSGAGYVSRAEACFGVTITQDAGSATGTWEVSTGTMPDPTSQTYINANCGDWQSDYNWRRVIMYVFDSRNMEYTGCFLGDDQSCQDFGYTSSGSSGTGTTP